MKLIKTYKSKTNQKLKKTNTAHFGQPISTLTVLFGVSSCHSHGVCSATRW